LLGAETLDEAVAEAARRERSYRRTRPMTRTPDPAEIARGLSADDAHALRCGADLDRDALVDAGIVKRAYRVNRRGDERFCGRRTKALRTRTVNRRRAVRTDKICRIEDDGTLTPMVLVPAAEVATPEPIEWHQDGQGGFEYEDGDDMLLTVTRIESSDPLVRFRCSVFLQSEATRAEPIFRVSAESAEMSKHALQTWLDRHGSYFRRD
jgi:hypothetical protein